MGVGYSVSDDRLVQPWVRGRLVSIKRRQNFMGLSLKKIGIVLLFVYICKFEVDALNSSYSQLDVFKSCVRQVGFYLDPLRELAFGISPYPFFIPHELDFCKFKVRQTCFLG